VLLKKLTGYLAIELFAPGGTLVILGLLLFGGSFPAAQERVLGALPKSLGALMRPEKPAGDRPEAPIAAAADSARVEG
jgi:hypothetical protein